MILSVGLSEYKALAEYLRLLHVASGAMAVRGAIRFFGSLGFGMLVAIYSGNVCKWCQLVGIGGGAAASTDKSTSVYFTVLVISGTLLSLLPIPVSREFICLRSSLAVHSRSRIVESYRA